MTWLIWAIIAWTALLSFALTFVARRIAVPAGFVDRPDGSRKQHDSPTPLLGGVAVCIAMLCGWLSLSVFGWLKQNFATPDVSMWPLAASACLFCLLGLWDDRRGLRPRTKFLLQIVACLPFACGAGSVQVIEVFGSRFDFGGWGIVFTVFWLVACANVINLMDGLDGLAGTISLTIVSTIAVLCWFSGNGPVALAAGAIAGALIGFLLHNLPPAKIFMGDAGSLMIGFAIGALSLQAFSKQSMGFGMAAPVALIGLPVFDTVMAILRRKLTGRSIGEADRGHVHHCLLDRGLSPIQVLVAINGFCLLTAAAAIGAVWLDRDAVAAVVCATLASILIAFRIFGHLEGRLFLAHVRQAYQLITNARRLLTARMLTARLPHVVELSTEEAWRQVCSFARQSGLRRLDFACVRARTDECLGRMHWKSSSSKLAGDGIWEFQVTIQRDEETVATMRVAGDCRDEGQSHGGEEMWLVAERFCRAWPITAAEPLPTIIAFPQNLDESEILESKEKAESKRSFRHAA